MTEQRTVVAGALGECVHVAGVMSFLRLAEFAEAADEPRPAGVGFAFGARCWSVRPRAPSDSSMPSFNIAWAAVPLYWFNADGSGQDAGVPGDHRAVG